MPSGPSPWHPGAGALPLRWHPMIMCFLHHLGWLPHFSSLFFVSSADAGRTTSPAFQKVSGITKAFSFLFWWFLSTFPVFWLIKTLKNKGTPLQIIGRGLYIATPSRGGEKDFGTETAFTQTQKWGHPAVLSRDVKGIPCPGSGDFPLPCLISGLVTVIL